MCQREKQGPVHTAWVRFPMHASSQRPSRTQVTPFVNASHCLCALSRSSSCLLTPFLMPPCWPGHYTAPRLAWLLHHGPHHPHWAGLLGLILHISPYFSCHHQGDCGCNSHLLILGGDPCNHLFQFFWGWQPSVWHLLSLRRGPEERKALIFH